MKYIVMFIGITFMSIGFAGEWSEGENLITKFDFPKEEWKAFEKKRSNSYSRLWQSATKGGDDIYAVSVYYGADSELKSFRERQDEPGIKNCIKFEPKILNYNFKQLPALFWFTDCTLASEGKVKMMHLAIKGNDSFYHLQKIWKFDVNEADINEWKSRIGKSFVCDTRSEENKCPEGYSKVK